MLLSLHSDILLPSMANVLRQLMSQMHSGTRLPQMELLIPLGRLKTPAPDVLGIYSRPIDLKARAVYRVQNPGSRSAYS